MGSKAVDVACWPATVSDTRSVLLRDLESRRVRIIATGAEYRKPAIHNLSTFEGAGVRRYDLQ
jgi:hypothetical protein